VPRLFRSGKLAEPLDHIFGGFRGPQIIKSGSETKPNMAQHFDPYQHQQHFSHLEQMRMSAHYADIHQTYAMQQQQMPMPATTKTNETKPRLGKDEVDILEREFKKNPKPTTQTKRQFAEDMGVELARINVGFQIINNLTLTNER